jgi:hypothetical protein
MDYTGTRLEGRESETSFYREVGEWLIAKIHPTSGYREPPYPEVVKSWRLGGYRLAAHLLPTRRRRYPDELRAFIDGMRQRLQEYAEEHAGEITLEQFDVGACEKIELKAQKYLKLATHPNTNPHEAASAATNLARMIAGSEMVLLSFGRVSHFAQRLQRMEEMFAMLKEADPFSFFFGPHDRH